MHHLFVANIWNSSRGIDIELQIWLRKKFDHIISIKSIQNYMLRFIWQIKLLICYVNIGIVGISRVG